MGCFSFVSTWGCVFVLDPHNGATVLLLSSSQPFELTRKAQNTFPAAHFKPIDQVTGSRFKGARWDTPSSLRAPSQLVLLRQIVHVDAGLINPSHYLGGVPSKSNESPLKGDTSLLINQGFIDPGLTFFIFFFRLSAGLRTAGRQPIPGWTCCH